AVNVPPKEQIVGAGGRLRSGLVAECGVEATCSGGVERVHAAGRVGLARGVGLERTDAAGGVEGALGVVSQRIHAAGCVLEAGAVRIERADAAGRVPIARDV